MLALADVAHRPNVGLWRGSEQDFLRVCRPHVFDIALIDGDHHGSAVARALRLVARTMKSAGKICCHDYKAPSHPGVTDSVNQFSERTEWCVFENTRRSNPTALCRDARHGPYATQVENTSSAIADMTPSTSASSHG
jgi:hypothetical protein